MICFILQYFALSAQNIYIMALIKFSFTRLKPKTSTSAFSHRYNSQFSSKRSTQIFKYSIPPFPVSCKKYAMPPFLVKSIQCPPFPVKSIRRPAVKRNLCHQYQSSEFIFHVQPPSHPPTPLLTFKVFKANVEEKYLCYKCMLQFDI